MKIFLLKKVSQCQTEMGDHLGFFNIHSVAKLRKIEWRPFGKKVCSKKMSHNAEKTEKPFWFSSLGQQVHIGDTLKFCRTILVTSGVSKKNTDEKP